MALSHPSHRHHHHRHALAQLASLRTTGSRKRSRKQTRGTHIRLLARPARACLVVLPPVVEVVRSLLSSPHSRAPWFESMRRSIAHFAALLPHFACVIGEMLNMNAVARLPCVGGR